MGAILARAFSLVELLIVIIIVSLLAAIAIPRVSNSSVRARETALRRDLRIIREAIDRFSCDTDLYPTSLNGLVLGSPPAQGRNGSGNLKALDASKWSGPYADGTLIDPVSKVGFSYKITPPKVGSVKSSAVGNASDGTPYSSW